jgi:hypothetical protein
LGSSTPGLPWPFNRQNGEKMEIQKEGNVLQIIFLIDDKGNVKRADDLRLTSYELQIDLQAIIEETGNFLEHRMKEALENARKRGRK